MRWSRTSSPPHPAAAAAAAEAVAGGAQGERRATARGGVGALLAGHAGARRPDGLGCRAVGGSPRPWYRGADIQRGQDRKTPRSPPCSMTRCEPSLFPVCSSEKVAETQNALGMLGRSRRQPPTRRSVACDCDEARTASSCPARCASSRQPWAELRVHPTSTPS